MTWEPKPERLLTCGHRAPCGCSGVAACCMDCPLPVCRFDAVELNYNIVKARRNAQIVAAVEGEGLLLREVAQQFGISPRTVLRVMKGRDKP